MYHFNVSTTHNIVFQILKYFNQQHNIAMNQIVLCPKMMFENQSYEKETRFSEHFLVIVLS